MARPKKVIEPPTAEKAHGAAVVTELGRVTLVCDCGERFPGMTKELAEVPWERHVKMARLQRSALRRNLITR